LAILRSSRRISNGVRLLIFTPVLCVFTGGLCVMPVFYLVTFNPRVHGSICQTNENRYPCDHKPFAYHHNHIDTCD